MLKVWNISVIIETRVCIRYSSRGKALAIFWVVENDDAFDSRIFLSVALPKFIRRVRVLNHAWLISFLELDEVQESVSSFKIYGPSLLAQRGTEGKSNRRKNQRHLSDKSTTVLSLNFPINSVNNGTNGSIIMIFSHLEQQVWIFKRRAANKKRMKRSLLAEWPSQ